MSLVSSYILCKDGKYYKDLVYRAEDRSWFICFDDDEPVEIVLKATSKQSPYDILYKLGIPYTEILKAKHATRVFGSGRVLDNLAPAIAYFIHVKNEPFPTPRKSDTYDEVMDSMPNRQGVYYGISP